MPGAPPTGGPDHKDHGPLISAHIRQLVRRPGQKAATNFISSPWLTCAAATASYKLKPQHKVGNPWCPEKNPSESADADWHWAISSGCRSAPAFWTRHSPFFPILKSGLSVLNSAFRGRVCPVAVALSIHLAEGQTKKQNAERSSRPKIMRIIKKSTRQKGCAQCHLNNSKAGRVVLLRRRFLVCHMEHGLSSRGCILIKRRMPQGQGISWNLRQGISGSGIGIPEPPIFQPVAPPQLQILILC